MILRFVIEQNRVRIKEVVEDNKVTLTSTAHSQLVATLRHAMRRIESKAVFLSSARSVNSRVSQRYLHGRQTSKWITKTGECRISCHNVYVYS